MLPQEGIKDTRHKANTFAQSEERHSFASPWKNTNEKKEFLSWEIGVGETLLVCGGPHFLIMQVSFTFW